MNTSQAVATLLVLSGGAIAQTDSQPKFDVASIKESAPSPRGVTILHIPGGVTMSNTTMRMLLENTYGIQAFQISNAPAWFDSVKYDITAKSENENLLTVPEVQARLQPLLADRFHLVVHRETKELPIFALVVARKDGKLGPSITQSKERTCAAPDLTKLPRFEPGKPIPPPCGAVAMLPRQLTGANAPIAGLAQSLTRALDRPVVDNTGLIGNFDVFVEWTSDEGLAPQSLDAPQPSPPSDPDGLSIFTALQEQLGLKLQSQKGPVEILAIDHVEKPSEN